MNPDKKPFYAGGLRFSCTRCSSCCRYEPGFVFLSAQDLRLLAETVKMEYTVFVETYCRWVPAPEGGERLSLREKAGFDCVFWENGCGVYHGRPLQCRTFPFWKSNLVSRQVWESLSCPGVNRGDLHDGGHIEACLERRRAEPVLRRP
ncbi:MAG: YkgJ family cysteine cluster protein [Treponema sp.]|nr:YkgJ family cysteine cluster protein [Treponema sp.]